MRIVFCTINVLTLLVIGGFAFAHGLEGEDASFVANARGVEFAVFLYLGAKHMVTGYDHLLFLVGVIFYLTKIRDVIVFATLFSFGHSLTLLAGVMFSWGVNAHFIDALIGLSVAYKAFDNIGGISSVLRFQPDAKAMVFGFGLIHGLGLATKLQALQPNKDGLFANLISFNVGVETGQFLSLFVIFSIFAFWRETQRFSKLALPANVVLMAAGFVLTFHQIAQFAKGM